jgi:mannose-6-phosphate isomerase-like protein (cupin superfamily)
MATRRVVTGIEGGRSVFLSDGAAPPVPGAMFEELWAIQAGDDFGRSPVAGDETLEGPTGDLRWRVVTIPTDEDIRRMIAALPAEQQALVNTEGWHTTKTVDLVYVLEGDVALQLDEGEVLLHPGDVVVQQGTKHAWHTRSEGPVKLLALMRTFP